ncbi:hypothetical protein SLNWT_6125 [Streptomyces albus]|uniref:Uncharacterized protein n=1 Tax=Streptomyces albus (strain ATCC 21838 / DSM 41398 / FERM P-419 / JCM 4703 / NBRC 107858) TaxID=1081613 RepID=A0A0B5F6I8_STRA4|nr:hypothetical protein SLNWT_6125 [Streptomyces albus]AOU80804.1 hypothetical protein SLNHY_6113 [Streptomyces albus]AYN36509.1 hypothetical protein DUI70_6016 [Streptomyces albus]
MAEGRLLAVPEDRDDLDLVVLGKRVGEVVGGPDGPADSVRVVEEKGDVHTAPYRIVCLRMTQLIRLPEG